LLFCKNLKKKYPLVSVVIPVYNGANYIREAIDSVLAQTYKNIEILIINDGSQDGGATRDIALSYGDKIKYFEKENGGVSTALNLGIRAMKGEYFSWLSHDDVYYPDKIKCQIGEVRFKKNVILYSDYDEIDEQSKIINKVRISHIKSEMFLFEIAKNSFLHGCSLLIPKEAFDDFGGFNEELLTTQDYDLWVKMSIKYRFVHLKKILIKSRIHTQQGSNKDIHVKEVEIFYLNILKIIDLSLIPALYKTTSYQYLINLSEIYKTKGFLTASQTAKDMALK
jgi:glycosyltransferase involved in cell wall biosynthesis